MKRLEDGSAYNIDSLSSCIQETVDRIHWRMFLRPNQRKMNRILQGMMQVVLRLVAGLIKGDVSGFDKFNAQFDEAFDVFKSVLKIKDTVEGETGALEFNGTGMSMIKSWSKANGEQNCFRELLNML